jgi:hypothetical protein
MISLWGLPSLRYSSSFWGIYEMGFPEGSNMKAQGDSGFPFGAFSFILAKKHLDGHQKQ